MSSLSSATASTSLRIQSSQRRQREIHHQRQLPLSQPQQPSLSSSTAPSAPAAPTTASTLSAAAASLAPTASILRDAVLAPSTIDRYKRALGLFLSWCDSNGVTDTSDYEQLDTLLCLYIEHLFRTKQPKTSASNAINAIQFFTPRCKSLLPECHLLIRGWDRLTPAQSHPPLTFELTVVIAVCMLRASPSTPSLYGAAVATLLAFDCYLRVGELCGIRVRDVALSAGHHFGTAYTGSAIALPRTKTGPNQYVTISMPVVQTLVTQLVSHVLSTSSSRAAPRDSLLFDFTADTYRKYFHAACHALNLSQYGFTPHSLRHGAATYAHLRHVPLDDILLRGRWRQPLSARIYIQAGPMMLIQIHEPTLQLAGQNIIRKQTLIHMFNYYRLLPIVNINNINNNNNYDDDHI